MNIYLSDNIVNVYNDKNIYNKVQNKLYHKYTHTACFFMILEYILDRCKKGLDILENKPNKNNRILYETQMSINIYYP